jgi:hypothetical protein
VRPSRRSTVATARTWTPKLAATIDRSPVPPDQAKAFAILRRPQSDADRSPAAQAALKHLFPSTISGVRVDAVRVLETRRGEVTILASVRRRLARSVRCACGGKTVTIPVRNSWYEARWVGADSSVGIAIPRFFDARDHEIKFR